MYVLFEIKDGLNKYFVGIGNGVIYTQSERLAKRYATKTLADADRSEINNNYGCNFMSIFV
jgi:hypothetical protein